MVYFTRLREGRGVRCSQLPPGWKSVGEKVLCGSAGLSPGRACDVGLRGAGLVSLKIMKMYAV